MRSVAVPVDFDSHSLAEFIEARLLLGEDDFLSIAEIRGEFPSGSKPSDLELEDALAEVERRSADFGALYPFRSEHRGVRIDRRDSSSLYACLLLLSLRGTPLRASGDYRSSDEVFDEIVRVAFRNHLGSGARALTFGTPPRGGRPGRFSLAVAWVADALGLEMRSTAINDDYQDAGVDVIAWRAYPDGRNAFPIILVQNTVEFEYRNKPRDVRPSQWRDWIAVGAQPRVGFAIPFAMPSGDPLWDHINLDVDVIMDRGRLMHELSSEVPTGWELWPQIKAFVDHESQDQPEAEGVRIVRRRKPMRSALRDAVTRQPAERATGQGLDKDS